MPYTEDRTYWFEGQGLWQHVPAEDWNNWTWQLKNRLTTADQLEQYMTLTPEEKIGCAAADTKLALSITPYFFNLINRNNLIVRFDAKLFRVQMKCLLVLKSS